MHAAGVRRHPGSRGLATPPAAVTRAGSQAAVDGAPAKDDLDAIIAPGPAYADVGAAAGYPTAIVPSGIAQDATQPQGLSFLGTAFDEQNLLRYAAAYEKGTQGRVPPTVTNPKLLAGC